MILTKGATISIRCKKMGFIVSLSLFKFPFSNSMFAFYFQFPSSRVAFGKYLHCPNISNKRTPWQLNKGELKRQWLGPTMPEQIRSADFVLKTLCFRWSISLTWQETLNDFENYLDRKDYNQFNSMLILINNLSQGGLRI